MSAKELIEKYQCPGCVCGSDTTCPKFKEGTAFNGSFCEGWVPGTMIFPGGTFALGMPKGFNKGYQKFRPAGFSDRGNWPIALLTEGNKFEFNKFNIAVWCREMEGDLFVRMFSPRINMTTVMVFEKAKQADLCPEATNVEAFIDEMD